MIVFIIDTSNYSLNWKKNAVNYTLCLWHCKFGSAMEPYFLIIWTVNFLETKSLTSCDVCFTHAQYIYTRHIENHVYQKACSLFIYVILKIDFRHIFLYQLDKILASWLRPSMCDHALIIYHVKGLYLSIFTPKKV